MQKILSYVTGALALLVVTAAIIGALVYAVTHGMATLNSLATSCLQGIGMAVGGMVGSMLVLRWKSARRYIGNTVQDIANKAHHPDDETAEKDSLGTLTQNKETEAEGCSDS